MFSRGRSDRLPGEWSPTETETMSHAIETSLSALSETVRSVPAIAWVGIAIAAFVVSFLSVVAGSLS